MRFFAMKNGTIQGSKTEIFLAKFQEMPLSFLTSILTNFSRLCEIKATLCFSNF